MRIVTLRGIGYDQVLNRHGATLLHLASRARIYDLCKFIVESQANLNLQDSNGYTALHLAAKMGFYNICELLVMARIDVDTQDNN